MSKEYWNEASSPEPCVGMVVMVPSWETEGTLCGTTSTGKLLVEFKEGAVAQLSRDQIASKKQSEAEKKQLIIVDTANKLAAKHGNLVNRFGDLSEAVAQFWVDIATEIEGCK